MTPRIPLGRAHALASSIIQELRYTGVAPEVLTPVGSLRRLAPDVGDVALLAVVPDRDRSALLRTFTALASALEITAVSPAGATIRTHRGSVTLHTANSDGAGGALVWLTGSVSHVRGLADAASERGLRLDAGALRDATGRELPCPTEEDVYAALGLAFVPPEMREGTGEIQASRERRLPDLLTSAHIRGDLHMHSTWSDGRDPIEAMVQASIELGYEYVAITDHSQRAWSSRKLAVEDVAAQRAEVDWIRARYPRLRLLHGVEVDIMKDGTLDFDDEVLSAFDLVLASLHDHGGQDDEQLTERYLSAMRSRFVDVITHPMGRSPAVSDGYALDLDRIFAAAVETGTAMEIDGAPGHLDMDGAIARRAAAAGVTIVVDSDCHRSEALRRQMRFAVGTARRGWIEPRHVLNTRSIDDVLAFVSRKRRRG